MELTFKKLSGIRETYIILCQDRHLMEKIENGNFESLDALVDYLREIGMTEDDENSLLYFRITDFMNHINNRALTDFSDDFISYINIIN